MGGVMLSAIKQLCGTVFKVIVAASLIYLVLVALAFLVLGALYLPCYILSLILF